MEHSFFPKSQPNSYESLRLLSLAETHLTTTRDLPLAKSLVTRACELDPSLPLANQFLAVIDTLITSDRRIANNQPDLYGILGMSPHQLHNQEMISSHYRNLVQLLDGNSNRCPFADVALRAVLEAYEVLSNPIKKVAYDKELAFYLQQQRLSSEPFKLPTMHQNFTYFGGAAAVNSRFSRGGNKNGTFNSGFAGFVNNNCVRGFSAFVNNGISSSSSRNGCNVNVVEENEQVEKGTQSFMGILGMDNNSNSNNRVQGFSGFVNSSSVPVVEGYGTNGDYGGCEINGPDVIVVEENEMDGDYANASAINGPRVNIVVENQETNGDYANASEINDPCVNIVVENQGTNGDYANASEINGPCVNIVVENQGINGDYAYASEIISPHVVVVDENQETNGDYANASEINGPRVNAADENQETNGDYSNGGEIYGLDVNVDGVDEEKGEERGKETGDETGNGGIEDTFWTACPYCCYMFEYPRVYVDCCMRCQFCKSAFQTVAIAALPDIVEGEDGKEGYYCCSSFFPVGVSKENWEKWNEGISGWTPFSPMFTQPGIGKKEFGGQGSGPRVDDDEAWMESSDSEEFDDEAWMESLDSEEFDDEAWMESSESEDFDDIDWIKERNKRKIVQTRVTRSSYKIAKKVRGDKSTGKSTKRTITPARKQPSRAAKNSGKLYLNVECSSNVAEEPPSKSNLSRGCGEDDNVEGNGFIEGLDEYLSSFPITDGVEGDDKPVKVA